MGNICCAPPKQNQDDISRGGPMDIKKLDAATKAKEDGDYGTNTYS
jgi:hypothetical protein